MANNCFVSEFNSEEKLKPKNAYSLPEFSIFAKSSELLMSGMDQLLITMADEGDIIITSEKIDKDYLEFWNNEICYVENYSPKERIDLKENNNFLEKMNRTGPLGSIYQKILIDGDMKNLFQDNHIVNYALVPDYYDMCSALGIPYDEPSLEVVKELNSKVYSNELKERFDLPAKGMHLKSVDEYEAWIKTHMNSDDCSKESDSYKYLIKDAMGVSGKGMLLMDSPGIAHRLLLHFRKQELSGAENFDFIVEPFLKKKTDFSCLFTIKEDEKKSEKKNEGKGFSITIDGFQKNVGKGFAYRGTGPLESEKLELIKISGYEDTVLRIADDMAERGYRGYGCIDSMITEDDKVIPVLEINPRMSMSRFNLKVSEKVGKECRLGFVEGKSARSESDKIGFNTDLNIKAVLSELDSKSLLYTKKSGRGVIPLAPGIWDNNKAAGKRVRIYYIIVYDTQENYEKILDAWLTYCSGSICAGNIT